MATQAIAGFQGKVLIQTGTDSTTGDPIFSALGEIKDATLTVSTGEIDATSFDSNGWSQFIPGLKDWTVEVEALYVDSDAGQSALWDALVNGDQLKVQLAPKGDASGDVLYEGSAFMTSWEVNNPIDDAVVLTMSLRGTGELLETAAV
nr:hypothetical protein 5 [bacterium]BDD47215.1 hypothetical protein 8 [bacterium]